MKVLVIGASGLTGKLSVEKLLAKGDDVTALVRDESQYKEKHDHLKTAKGEARDAESLVAAVTGQDAVLSAFGPRSMKKDDLQEVFMKNLIAAMEKANVKRLVNLSAWGAGDSYDSLWPPARFILKTFMGEMFKDKERGETLLFASKVDFVNVRPGRLSNSAARGAVKMSLDAAELKWWPFMTRDDVANVMVESLTASEWVRKSPLMGY